MREDYYKRVEHEVSMGIPPPPQEIFEKLDVKMHNVDEILL